MPPGGSGLHATRRPQQRHALWWLPQSTHHGVPRRHYTTPTIQLQRLTCALADCLVENEWLDVGHRQQEHLLGKAGSGGGGQ